MANNHKDDGSFDDTDFDDLDMIEDDDLGDEAPTSESFADDAWDDEEAHAGAGDEETRTADDDVALENNANTPVKKTFIQKNFGLIAVAVVVVFGGIAALPLMGGNSATRPAAETTDALPVAADATAFDANAPSDLAETEAMPPMPAPINPSEDINSDDALTPMPMPGQADDTELAALDVEEIPAAPAGKTTPQGEKPFDFPAEEPDPALADDGTGKIFSPDEAPSLPAAAPQEPQEKSPTEKAADYASAQFRARAGLSTDDISNSSTARPSSKDEEREKEEYPPVTNLTPQLEAQKSEIAALQKKLDAQQAQAKQSANDLKSSLEQKNEEISSLQKSVKALEKELSAARSAAAKSAEAVKAAKQAPPLMAPEPDEPEQVEPEQEIASEKVPASEKPASSASSRTSKQDDMAKAPAKDLIPQAKPAPVKAAAWELKGASPGKAVLWSKTTGDTRNVAVGDTVQGLGKITTIARENGRWTVRGTQGTVIR